MSEQRITDERLAQMIETNELIVKTNRPVFPLSGREMTELLAEVKDARRRIAELERERKEAVDFGVEVTRKLVKVRTSLVSAQSALSTLRDAPPRMTRYDMQFFAGKALADMDIADDTVITVGQLWAAEKALGREANQRE